MSCNIKKIFVIILMSYYFLGMKRFRNQDKRPVPTRGQIPEMINAGNRISTSQINSILIIKLKRPRVKILKGMEITFIKGFRKKFTNPKTIPAKIKIFINSPEAPCITTPGIKSVAK